jgi:hypothetical protein
MLLSSYGNTMANYEHLIASQMPSAAPVAKILGLRGLPGSGVTRGYPGSLI